ncbi:MAG: Bax inhibitor-1/YccA family protein [Thiobacillus sp.]|nr:Bax inhibitor-1/YccA family protein [Thiobacillus sp.]
MQQPLRSTTVGTFGNASSLLATHKVLRNTYMLLAATLLFSAVTAGLSMAIGAPRFTGLVCSLAAMALIWFALPRTANSEKGIYVVFGITGLLGFGLGPMLNHYLKLANGGELVMTALGGTALIFGALSGYVLTTKKDFSFMGGFLMTGLIVLLVASLGVVAASFFGLDVSMAFIAISAVSVLLFSGLILYDTSRIINGGETNYIMATVALYLDVYNIFTSLLHLLGFASSDD